MTLGTNIQQLRKEHNMSQGDLADALDISRQSVSKWETDTATPDLDKLLKLSEIFSVSLDELVKGADDTPPTPPDEQTKPSESSEPIKHYTIPADTSPQEPIPVTIKTGLETRQIAGIILLCMAFLTVLIFTILGGFLAGLIYCLPFLICGIICMFVKKHVGIYCGWVIVILLELLTRFAMSVHWQLVFQPWLYTNSYPLHIALCWAHFAVILFVIGSTLYEFHSSNLEFNTRTKHILLCCIVIYLFLHLPFGKYLLSSITIKQFIHSNWWLISCLNVVLTLGRQILFTILVVYALAWCRQKKSI